MNKRLPLREKIKRKRKSKNSLHKQFDLIRKFVFLYTRLRALTTIERSYIQTFPKDFKFEGTKSNLEQMIGNAVPVKLAEYIANCIKEFQQDFDANKLKIANKFGQLELEMK